MAQQFNQIIATQTVNFRGTSSVQVQRFGPSAFQNAKATANVIYAASVTNGVSDAFSVHILGSIGGSTYIIAGVTGIAAVGNFILYPATYAAAGTLNALETAISIATKQIDQIVPPTVVVFETNDEDVGESTTVTVSACGYASR